MKVKSDILHSLFGGLLSSVLLRQRNILQGYWTGSKCICISFDCDYLEDMQSCPKIINFLKTEDIHASFAIPGQFVIRFPEVIDELIKNGQEILNHTLSHFSNFRKMGTDDSKLEIEGFQELMVKRHGYLPKGFRCPHGLRQVKVKLFEILKRNKMYDSSLLGYNVTNKAGIWEIPLTPCPEHPFLAFDTYHNFRFPLFVSSEKKVIRLWTMLLEKLAFINIFLDPLDLAAEIRLKLLKNMINSAKEYGFSFSQMGKIYENLLHSENFS